MSGGYLQAILNRIEAEIFKVKIFDLEELTSSTDKYKIYPSGNLHDKNETRYIKAINFDTVDPNFQLSIFNFQQN